MTESAETTSKQPLAGKVAVVTGASRGVGKGIAWELGIAGATVYVTGRSVRGKPTTDGLPGTVHETAELVTEAGGEGVPVVCDHTRDEDVAALAETVGAGHGRLDLLVNNVWGGYEGYDPKLFTLPFWEQPLWRWDRMFDTGVRGHYTATRALAPLMLANVGGNKRGRGKKPRGLIVSTPSGCRRGSTSRGCRSRTDGRWVEKMRWTAHQYIIGARCERQKIVREVFTRLADAKKLSKRRSQGLRTPPSSSRGLNKPCGAGGTPNR